jgi:hypothetical protein
MTKFFKAFAADETPLLLENKSMTACYANALVQMLRASRPFVDVLLSAEIDVANRGDASATKCLDEMRKLCTASGPNSTQALRALRYNRQEMCRQQDSEEFSAWLLETLPEAVQFSFTYYMTYSDSVCFNCGQVTCFYATVYLQPGFQSSSSTNGPLPFHKLQLKFTKESGAVNLQSEFDKMGQPHRLEKRCANCSSNAAENRWHERSEVYHAETTERLIVQLPLFVNRDGTTRRMNYSLSDIPEEVTVFGESTVSNTSYMI